MTRPNFEPVMNTGGDTRYRASAQLFTQSYDIASKTIYFGPMGCRIGFYLDPLPAITNLGHRYTLTEMFTFSSVITKVRS